MNLLDIREVVERSGVPPSTLRYYEKIGLIRPVGRRGLRRQYDRDVLMTLSLIAMGQSAGFSLVEIAGMFGSDGRPDIPRANLHAKADTLQRQISDLPLVRFSCESVRGGAGSGGHLDRGMAEVFLDMAFVHFSTSGQAYAQAVA